MAYCAVCGNYDKTHVEDLQDNFKTVPDEDFDWRDKFPNVDCMCEICFDIANEEKKIKWQLPRCQTHLQEVSK